MKLQIFISQHCVSCGRSAALGEAVASHFDDITVEIIDIDDPYLPRPDTVFAAPTFLLDGSLLCLGNQDEAWLIERVMRVKRNLGLAEPGAAKQPAGTTIQFTLIKRKDEWTASAGD